MEACTEERAAGILHGRNFLERRASRLGQYGSMHVERGSCSAPPVGDCRGLLVGRLTSCEISFSRPLPSDAFMHWGTVLFGIRRARHRNARGGGRATEANVGCLRFSGS
jgi:hypothetical protein